MDLNFPRVGSLKDDSGIEVGLVFAQLPSLWSVSLLITKLKLNCEFERLQFTVGIEISRLSQRYLIQSYITFARTT